MRKTIKFKNVIYFFKILIIEIIIGVYVNDSIIRPYFGDILVIPLIFLFLNIFIVPNNFTVIKIVCFAIFIEIMQYFNIVTLLKIENKILKIIIGTTFDTKDIFCYMIGGVLTFFIARSIKNVRYRLYT